MISIVISNNYSKIMIDENWHPMIFNNLVGIPFKGKWSDLGEWDAVWSQTKENKDVTIRLYYDERGLDKYYGLLELGEVGGLWKNVAGRYEIDGKKIYAKAVYKEPEKYFTPEVMQALDEIAQKQFSYGH